MGAVRSAAHSAGMPGCTAPIKVFLADFVCAWNSQSTAPWLTVTNGGSGNGNGTLKFAVQPNTDSTLRIGTIQAGDRTFTVTQAAKATSNSSGGDSGGDSSGGGGGGGDGDGGGGGDSGGSPG